MKAAIFTVAAIIGFIGCNKEAKRDADGSVGDAAARNAVEETRQTAGDVKEGAQPNGGAMANESSRANENSRASGGALDNETSKANESSKAAADELMAKGQRSETRIVGSDSSNKIVEETRQTSRDIGEGAAAAASKTKEEARQTSRDIGEVFAGDKSKTDADKALTGRIRTALKNDKAAAKEASDVNIDTDNGVVSLTGTVGSAEDKREIARVAMDVAGKAKVRNEIKVAERVGSGSND